MLAPNIVLAPIVGVALGLIIWEHPPSVWGWMQLMGICLLSIGFILWTVARFQLGKSFSVSAQARQLVTHGLYSKLRNPIYVFGSCVITGLILTLGHPIWLLVFLIIIPLQIWRANKESSVLEAAFGDEYRRYRAQTWF